MEELRLCTELLLTCPLRPAIGGRKLGACFPAAFSKRTLLSDREWHVFHSAPRSRDMADGGTGGLAPHKSSDMAEGRGGLTLHKSSDIAEGHVPRSSAMADGAAAASFRIGGCTGGNLPTGDAGRESVSPGRSVKLALGVNVHMLMDPADFGLSVTLLPSAGGLGGSIETFGLGNFTTSATEDC